MKTNQPDQSSERNSFACLMTVDGNPVGLNDILWIYKTTDSFEAGPLRELLLTQVAVREAECLGIEIGDDDLEDAVRQFYADRDLMEADQMEAWRRTRQLDGNEVESQIRRRLLRHHLEERMASNKTVSDWLNQHPYDYQEAILDALHFESAGVAAEMLLSLREKDQTLEHAVELATATSCVRLIRKDTPEELAAIVFSTVPGAWIGPQDLDDGTHAIYCLVTIQGVERDEDLFARVRHDLLEEFYNHLLERTTIEYMPEKIICS